MEPIQNKVINLLQEIHNICEQLNISYILGGTTAEEAALFGELPNGRYTATVYMTLKDFVQFREYVNANRVEDRVIEGMDNSSYFPGFYFHYVDKNTTYYNYNYGNSYKCNGIHVKITILKKFSNSKKVKKLIRKEKSFSFNSYKFNRKLSARNRARKFFMGIRLLFARKSIASNIYNRSMKAYMEDKDFVMNYGILDSKKAKLIKYPSYLLTGRVTAELCGHTFYVPQNIEQHIKLIMGRKPLENLPEQINNSTVIISDIIPYEEYLTDMKQRNSIAGLRQKIKKNDKMHGAVTYFIRKDWKIMECVNARLDLINEYMPQKESLIKAYQSGDFDSLTELLTDYDEQARHHLSQTGMSIYFDKEIFDIYLVWLGRNYGARIAGRMRKSVPKEWKKG